MPTVPKRTSELQRDRSRRGQRDPVTYGALRPVSEWQFDKNEDWHYTAQLIWDSALDSGQVDYWQNSDYAYLYMACEQLSAYLLATRGSAMWLAEINKMLDNLLLTDGARRKVRLELQPERAPEQGLGDLGRETYSDLFGRTGIEAMESV